jgi:DNA-binding MarR family transcriptional regulator/N-acetylglutamate synthase-like GNAT family acetyltransferase
MSTYALPSDDHIEAFRAFNRFYTRQLGLLEEGLLKSEFSLTEVRVLYELAHREALTATDLARDLALDAGYLSRILKKFERRDLIDRRRSDSDGRRTILSLNRAGRRAFEPLNRASHKQASALLAELPPPDQDRLLAAMGTIRRLLGESAKLKVPYVLRPPRPGDPGWIVHRQGLLYWREYGWDETFEALVAEIVGTFFKSFDPKREQCWIAEREGEIVGSVFLARQDDDIARLRLLYVEPGARGLGIGGRLVDECIAFARTAGYRTLSLWTNDVLAAARHIYQSRGFELVREEPHHSFGKDLVGQYWDLAL